MAQTNLDCSVRDVSSICRTVLAVMLVVKLAHDKHSKDIVTLLQLLCSK